MWISVFGSTEHRAGREGSIMRDWSSIPIPVSLYVTPEDLDKMVHHRGGSPHQHVTSECHSPRSTKSKNVDVKGYQ